MFSWEKSQKESRRGILYRFAAWLLKRVFAVEVLIRVHCAGA